MLDTNNDTINPTVADINFRVAEHDRDGTVARFDANDPFSGFNESSRGDNQYFYQPAGERFVALGRLAPTRDINLNPGTNEDRGNIDIIGKAWDRFGTGDNSDDIGIKWIFLWAPGRRWGARVGELLSFAFDGEFIRTTHTYGFLRDYHIARTVYENDQKSDSRNGGPYWYIVTNTPNVGGEFSATVAAVDRGRYWNSDVAQGNPWNDLDETHDAARNAQAQFPDDIYDVRVRVGDNQANQGQLTVAVVLDNFPQTIGTDKGAYAPNEMVMVQSGEGYIANEQVPLFVLDFPPTEGMMLPGFANAAALADADGVLQPGPIGTFPVGQYWLVADYNQDQVYDSRLDALCGFVVGGGGVAIALDSGLPGV